MRRGGWITDGNGAYSFEVPDIRELTDYSLTETLPSGWTLTDPPSSYFGQVGPGQTIGNLNFGSIPEPTTMSLLALGGLAMLRRRK